MADSLNDAIDALGAELGQLKIALGTADPDVAASLALDTPSFTFLQARAHTMLEDIAAAKKRTARAFFSASAATLLHESKKSMEALGASDQLSQAQKDEVQGQMADIQTLAERADALVTSIGNG